MVRKLEISLGMTPAALMVVLVGYAPTSTSHGPEHAPPQVMLSRAADGPEAIRAHPGHGTPDSGGHHEHRHDTTECTCRGACAATGPRAAPDGAAPLASPRGVERSVPVSRATRPVPPSLLKAHLVPLPNAPPVAA
jgi:hypothetical protein